MPNPSFPAHQGRVAVMKGGMPVPISGREFGNDEGDKMKRIWRSTAALVALATLGVVVLTAAGGAGARPAQGTAAFPREQTLITGGTQWGNIAGTNPYVGNYATGMVGLVNETLLRYDPLKDSYINWLAKSAKFTGPRQYTIVVRPGIKWADGKTFTGADVTFNLNLTRFNTSPWNNLYLNIAKIVTHGNTVNVLFKDIPNFVQWQNAMWNIPMISPTQATPLIKTAADLTTYSPQNPIGTGPYQISVKGYDPTTRVAYVKKAHWWAADQGISPSPKPKYVIDLVNTSNTNSLAAVLSGVVDLNNAYLPGVQKLADSGKVQTYFKKAPYNLSANTAWLEPNTTVKPLNDPTFRKALATAININQIVKEDYGNLVLKASPAALLPTFKKYIDPSLVKQYGFSYSTAKAKTMLENAGYKQSGGYFTNKDGSKIDLEISVPQGWSDWETARDMIVSSAKDAGIRLSVKVKDFNTWQTDRNTGKFDLVIDNPAFLTDSPWIMWNIVYHLPIITTGTGQTNFNYERYENPTAWALVQRLDKTAPTNTAAIKEINKRLQTILMQDMPVIPLWYNGVWAQFTSSHWTSWPSSTGAKYVPAMWRGYLQMTGIDVITHLKHK
jgi:peptide/nickel transport system substrate-binding protein